MITFGYVKDHQYANDGTLMIKIRIPSVHGAYDRSQYRGKTIHNYVEDSELPWIPSVLLPHLPAEGEVAAVAAMDSGLSNFIVLGLTGGSYNSGATNPELR
ncbi:hypothetical protein [Ruminococcus sp.]|uniref:hypothetical protein n=1 Tax=Ruminococcus sp. TaxID=41978 RepID=UPI001B488B23|nr:hypothetical protein [Ruminococcus sp.]MBP5433649.1 hypothetical protein [Ruminococcus sp.]